MTWHIESMHDGTRQAWDENGQVLATAEDDVIRVCWMEDGKEVGAEDAPRIPRWVLRRLLDG